MRQYYPRFVKFPKLYEYRIVRNRKDGTTQIAQVVWRDRKTRICCLRISDDESPAMRFYRSVI